MSHLKRHRLTTDRVRLNVHQHALDNPTSLLRAEAKGCFKPGAAGEAGDIHKDHDQMAFETSLTMGTPRTFMDQSRDHVMRMSVLLDKLALVPDVAEICRVRGINTRERFVLGAGQMCFFP